MNNNTHNSLKRLRLGDVIAIRDNKHVGWFVRRNTDYCELMIVGMFSPAIADGYV